MDGGTKNWWMFAKWSDEYERGVGEYVKKAFASKSQGNQICCPCEICHYRFWRHEGVVRDHLICNGFVPRTDKLSELGINIQREETILDNDEGSNPNDSNDDIVGLLHDARDGLREGPNDEAKKFLRLVEEGQEELYPGSKNHSKLSFMIRLFILKCDHKLTNAAFGDILELIREVLPDAKLPTSFNEVKSVLKVLGLDYTKINDGLNQNADAVETDCEGDEEVDRQVVAQYGMEGQFISTETENELSSKRKKHRGPTMLSKVHARTRKERQVIVLNSLGQPVGPTKEIVQEFKFFLGTVARDSELAPLNYINFPSLPTLDNIWDYVQEKYVVPHAGIIWVMDAVNRCWKYHKCQIKKKHFYAYQTDDLRWKNKPDTISDRQFRDLLQYWHTDEAKAISNNNKDNCLMLDDMHTLGRKSFAILRHELQQQDPDKQEPSQAKVYKESRKRSAERTYITSCEKAKENIAKIDALESTQHEDGNNCNDPYYEVIPAPNRKSRVHLYGSGVKKTDLKKKDTKSDFIFPEEFLASMQAQLVQQLAPSVTTAVLAQIREANPGINLVIPDVVVQLTPNDASSAPHHFSNQSGQSSKSGAACNQLQETSKNITARNPTTNINGVCASLYLVS